MKVVVLTLWQNKTKQTHNPPPPNQQQQIKKTHLNFQQTLAPFTSKIKLSI